MTNLRAFWACLSDALARYVIHRYRPGGMTLPVLRVRGKAKAMKRREELQKDLTPREREWGFGYYVVKQ